MSTVKLLDTSKGRKIPGDNVLAREPRGPGTVGGLSTKDVTPNAFQQEDASDSSKMLTPETAGVDIVTSPPSYVEGQGTKQAQATPSKRKWAP